MDDSSLAEIQSDNELLSLVRSVLESEKYAVELIESDDGLKVLLAENALFILAVTAVPRVRDIEAAEGIAESILSARVSESDLGPKRWDAYLIMLTQERLSDGSSSTRTLFDINYDTRAVRRIAQSSVTPTLADVRRVMIPFVAPVELDDPALSQDAVGMLLESLAARNIDSDVALRAVTAFRHGVAITDAV